jgi:hypothetical protein
MMANLLAAVLVKDRIPVSPADKEALRELLYWFPLPLPEYRYIHARADVLASLSIDGPDAPPDPSPGT